MLLAAHGYDPGAVPCGAASRSGDTSAWRNPAGELLRYRVCELEGVLIDGHEGSDLGPGAASCIHCDYEGAEPVSDDLG